jgi:uncharacterized protein (DUF1684 family)
MAAAVMVAGVMVAAVMAAGTMTAGTMEPAPPDYEAEIHTWRKDRETRLKSDEGWLTVAGIFWLKPGENRFGSEPGSAIVLPKGSAPARAGRFFLAGDSVRVVVESGVPITCEGKPVEKMKLRSDGEGKPDVLVLNDLRLFVIKRGKGYAIRMRHLNAPARKSFTGIDYFPIDVDWRIDGRFVAYDPPKPVAVPNIIGTVDTMLAPGYVEFARGGRTVRLEPVLETDDSDELFFIFKDETSGKETYPPGRFLYSSLPADGKVVLDFNRAYNPPCAFTDFATCPLPPPQNHLKLRVTAGEKHYRHH